MVVPMSTGPYPTFAAAYTALGPTVIGQVCGMSKEWAAQIARGRALPSLRAVFLLEQRLGVPLASWREAAEHRLERRVA
jgi:transcriptional regulator with XRE-family HTH domain